VKVVDFGAAMVIGASRITKTGVVYGTPHYMSPEQAAGQQLDHRADIYALGVLTFEMLIGNVPFEADTYMEVLRMHMMVAPIKPSSVAPAISPELDRVILNALAKKVDDRFLTMESFAAAIEKAALTLAPDTKLTAFAPTERFDSGPAPTRGATTAALVAHLPIRSRARTALIGGAVAIAGSAIAIALAHANGAARNDDHEAPNLSTSVEKPSSPASPSADQKSIDAVVAAPLSTKIPDPPALTAQPTVPPHSSPRPRDPATSVSAPIVKQTARPGDFPDPWSK
jgi:serine/threonine protein kinase